MAIEGLSIDQLRAFVSVVDEGGFSAAARRLRRAQSAISHAVANLETQLGVKLLKRDARPPALTDGGRMLLADARATLESVDALRSRARGMAGGLEAELSVVADVMYPLPELTIALTDFREAFPMVPLRLHVETLGAVLQPVLERRSRLAIAGMPRPPAQLAGQHIRNVQLLAVCAPAHPLARLARPAAQEALDEETQLVLTDRSAVTSGRDYGVFSPRDWRLADLGAKHALLRTGLGWGFMPEPLIAQDLAAGTLVDLGLHARLPRQGLMPLYAAYLRDDPPGPAGTWLIERLRTLAAGGEDNG